MPVPATVQICPDAQSAPVIVGRSAGVGRRRVVAASARRDRRRTASAAAVATAEQPAPARSRAARSWLHHLPDAVVERVGDVEVAGGVEARSRTAAAATPRAPGRRRRRRPPLPLPATVSMTPVARSTARTRWLSVSAMNSRPSGPNSMSRGCDELRAAVAGPPSPREPGGAVARDGLDEAAREVDPPDAVVLGVGDVEAPLRRRARSRRPARGCRRRPGTRTAPPAGRRRRPRRRASPTAHHGVDDAGAGGDAADAEVARVERRRDRPTAPSTIPFGWFSSAAASGPPSPAKPGPAPHDDLGQVGRRVELADLVVVPGGEDQRAAVGRELEVGRVVEVDRRAGHAGRRWSRRRCPGRDRRRSRRCRSRFAGVRRRRRGGRGGSASRGCRRARRARTRGPSASRGSSPATGSPSPVKAGSPLPAQVQMVPGPPQAGGVGGADPSSMDGAPPWHADSARAASEAKPSLFVGAVTMPVGPSNARAAPLRGSRSNRRHRRR